MAKSTANTKILGKYQKRLIHRPIVTGEQFGQWEIISGPQKDESGRQRMVCRCECGVTRAVQCKDLLSGKTRSCGCKKRKHEHSINGTTSPTYRSWVSMKTRCLNANVQEYARYGGRGITIHPEWIDSFAAFLRDVGERPTLGHSLDRIDNDKGYYPGNVRWALSKTQNRNRRSNRHLTLGGVTLTVVEWAERTGIPQATITDRLARGWSNEEALKRERSRNRNDLNTSALLTADCRQALRTQEEEQ